MKSQTTVLRLLLDGFAIVLITFSMAFVYQRSVVAAVALVAAALGIAMLGERAGAPRTPHHQ